MKWFDAHRILSQHRDVQGSWKPAAAKGSGTPGVNSYKNGSS
jgi:hypothetical protein